MADSDSPIPVTCGQCQHEFDYTPSSRDLVVHKEMGGGAKYGFKCPKCGKNIRISIDNQ